MKNLIFLIPIYFCVISCQNNATTVNSDDIDGLMIPIQNYIENSPKEIKALFFNPIVIEESDRSHINVYGQLSENEYILLDKCIVPELFENFRTAIYFREGIIYYIGLNNSISDQLIQEEISFRWENNNLTILNRITKNIEVAEKEKIKRINELDSLALIELYKSAKGKNWKNKWDLTKPVTEWYGVALRKFDRQKDRSINLNFGWGKGTLLFKADGQQYKLKVSEMTQLLTGWKGSGYWLSD